MCLKGSGCKILSHSDLANVNIRKRMFDPLSKKICAFSNGLDQPEHPPSLIRVIALHMKINLSSI